MIDPVLASVIEGCVMLVSLPLSIILWIIAVRLICGQPINPPEKKP